MSSSARRLTGIVGRWSAGHPWTAIAAWLGAVAVLMVTGHLAGTIQLPNGAQNVGPSAQAEQMISRDFPRHAVENVLFDSARLRVGDPAYRAAIRDVLSRIEATGRVIQIQSPLDPRFANQVSATRHAALVQFRVTGSVNDSATTVVPVLAAVRALLGPRNWYLPHWLGWLPQASPPVPPVPPPATRPPVGALGP